MLTFLHSLAVNEREVAGGALTHHNHWRHLPGPLTSELETLAYLSHR